MAEQQEYWKAETVAFYALQSLHGVGFKTLYRIAAQKISFRELIRTDDISYFEKMLRLKLEESIKNSPENWAHFKLELWSKGLDIARHLAKENVYLIFYGHESYPSQLKILPNPYVVICSRKYIKLIFSICCYYWQQEVVRGWFMVNKIYCRHNFKSRPCIRQWTCWRHWSKSTYRIDKIWCSHSSNPWYWYW